MVATDVSVLATAPAPPSSRNGGIDALRAALTGLVVLHHAALTYGGTGGWFYREIAPSAAPSSLLLTLFCTVNQAWFMGLFFLIAGYLTPGAVERRGVAGFLTERLVRLGLPLVVFGFVLGPVTVALSATAKGHDFLAALGAVWLRVPFIPGPLWFAEALLLFSAAYALWRRVAGAPPAAIGFPSNRALAAAAVATGAAAFLIRLAWPVGKEFLALQFGYFASYVVLFAAGCIGAQARWLERIPPRQAVLWRRIALAALMVFPLLAVAAATTPTLAGPPTGGFNVMAAVYAIWEPLVAWGAIMTLLVAFEARFDRLDAFWSAAARRAYLVYIIHPPVLVGVSLLLRGLAAPALVKFALAGGLAVALCFLLAGLLLRLAMLRRVV
jgi:fucose 4-O-acetylase-like acetyltransferase